MTTTSPLLSCREIRLFQRAVSFSAIAPAPGALTSATFAYSKFPCPAAVKIKFFRSEGGFFLRFLAERGPFDVTQAIQTVPLSPPVSVLAGDSLAITRLSDCGTPLEQTPPLPEDPLPELLYFERDVSQDTLVNDAKLILSATLALAAFGEADPFPLRVVPVIFTGAGAANSQFRTEALIHNPTDNFISGGLVFPSTSSRVPNGYAVRYSLGPYETQSVPLPGFGSVDIIPTIGPGAVALVHVFNDAGPAGTVGFTESDVPTSEALGTGEQGVLLGPADTDNFRFNIGFRSLGLATLLVKARSHDGTLVATGTLSVGRFLQRSAQDLLQVPLQPGMTFTVEVTSGAVIVYGVTADNRTNDTSFQLARHVGG